MKHAVIIGGGITGLFSAWYLREAGWKVSVVDRSDMLSGCSYGNAGLIPPSHFVPLAAPGVLSQGFQWMFRPGSPFGIHPHFSAEMFRWGFHFMRSATAAHVARSAVPLRDLLVMGRSLYEDLTSRKALDIQFHKKGLIMYFQTPAHERHERKLAETARGLGLEAEICDRRRLMEMEPGLQVNALGGVHYKSDAHLHPGALMKELTSRLGGQVTWIRAEVSGFRRSEGKVVAAIGKEVAAMGKEVAAMGKESEIPADLFVLAGGYRSGHLAARLGMHLPVMPGKGYSVTLENHNRLPLYPAILCEARVALTPMNGALRFGGTMEIGVMRKNINTKRIKAMVKAVNAYLPGLEVTMPPLEQVWTGFRPVSADGLPYIGRPAGCPNLIVATGHSMLGIALGPATGKIVAQLAAGEKPIINMEPFRPDRFG